MSENGEDDARRDDGRDEVQRRHDRRVDVNLLKSQSCSMQSPNLSNVNIEPES